MPTFDPWCDCRLAYFLSLSIEALARIQLSTFVIAPPHPPRSGGVIFPGSHRRRSSMPKATTLGAEVTNVSGHYIWILIDDEELALPYSDYPWFRSAIIQQILNVLRSTADHLFWPALDVDLSVESIHHLERFTLRSRSTFQPCHLPWPPSVTH